MNVSVDTELNVTSFTDLPVSIGETRTNFLGIVTTVELFFGLIFHILAVLATRKAEQLWRGNNQRQVPHFLFNALRIIDFGAVIFFLLRGFASPIKQWSLLFRCEFGVSTSLFFTTASGLANVAMCVERCIALLAPFSYLKHVTLFKAKVTIAIAVGIAFIFSILPLLGLSSYRYDNGEMIVCVSPGDIAYDVDFILVHTMLFFIIGFLIVIPIFICNFIVVYFILKLNRTTAPVRTVRNIPKIVTSPSQDESALQNNETFTSEQSTIQDQGAFRNESTTTPVKDPGNQRKHDIQLAVLFIVVSVIYTISWLPLYMERLMAAFQIEKPEILFTLTIWLLILNHVVDPVLFVFFKKKNQQALKLLFLKVSCCLSPSYRAKVEQSTMSAMTATNLP